MLSYRETIEAGHQAIEIENDQMRVRILPERGAEIRSLEYKPKGMNVLWTAPWSMRRRTNPAAMAEAGSEAAWMDAYGGGWQDIFPSGGDACVYRGAAMSFHGEAAVAAWDFNVRRADQQAVEIEFQVALARTPFTLRRTVRAEAGLAGILISERITNDCDEELHYMWGQHPAFASEFLAGGCRLRVPARRFVSHGVDLTPNSRLAAGVTSRWPMVEGRDGQPLDLSVIPGPEGRSMDFGYICDLDEGWYTLESRKHGFGIGLAWPKEVYPLLWLWQELRGSMGYPWWGRCYVMAVEPFTTMPGDGLAKGIEAGTAPLLAPGGSVSAEIAAVFFEGEVRGVGVDGRLVR
ncbi:MAG: DUF4432 family protein [Acidobacteria bacterium]|nr:DUF4432 family protein [Acidobacteriota bacterium]